VPTAESTQTIPKPLISQGLDANPAYTRCFYKGASSGNFYTVGEKRGEEDRRELHPPDLDGFPLNGVTLILFTIAGKTGPFPILKNS
jgi:hypothetical protein